MQRLGLILALAALAFTLGLPQTSAQDTPEPVTPTLCPAARSARPVSNQFLITLSEDIPAEDIEEVIDQLVEQYEIEPSIIFATRSGFAAMIPAAETVMALRADPRVAGVAQDYEFPFDLPPSASCPTPTSSPTPRPTLPTCTPTPGPGTATPTPTAHAVPDVYIVVMSGPADSPVIVQLVGDLARRYGLQVRQIFTWGPSFTAMVPPNRLATLRADPRVRSVVQDSTFALVPDYYPPCTLSRAIPTPTALPGYLRCQQPGTSIPDTYEIILAMPAAGLRPSDIAQIGQQMSEQYGLRLLSIVADSLVAQIPPERLPAVRADSRVQGVGPIVALSIDGEPVSCPTPPLSATSQPSSSGPAADLPPCVCCSPVPGSYSVALSEAVPPDDRERAIARLAETYGIPVHTVFGEARSFRTTITDQAVVAAVRADPRVAGVAQDYSFPYGRGPGSEDSSCGSPPSR